MIDGARAEALRQGNVELAPPVRLVACDLERVLSALGQPQVTFGGHDLYPDLISKAAALLYFVAKGHVCPDGNKRAAFILATAFLELNGVQLKGDDEERAVLIAEVVSMPGSASALAQQRLKHWLENSTPPKATGLIL